MLSLFFFKYLLMDSIIAPFFLKIICTYTHTCVYVYIYVILFTILITFIKFKINNTNTWNLCLITPWLCYNEADLITTREESLINLRRAPDLGYNWSSRKHHLLSICPSARFSVRHWKSIKILCRMLQWKKASDRLLLWPVLPPPHLAKPSDTSGSSRPCSTVRRGRA